MGVRVLTKARPPDQRAIVRSYITLTPLIHAKGTLASRSRTDVRVCGDAPAGARRKCPDRVIRGAIPERGARMARREERANREYVSDEQRRQPGCPARELCHESRGRDTREVRMGQLVARHRVLTALVSALMVIVGVWVVAAPHGEPDAHSSGFLRFSAPAGDQEVRRSACSCSSGRRNGAGRELPSGKHSTAAQPAEVLVKLLATADPLKFCRRSAAVAGRSGG